MRSTLLDIANRSLKVQLFLFVVGTICAIYIKLDSAPQIGFEIVILMWSLLASVFVGAFTIIFGLIASIYFRNSDTLKSCIASIGITVVSALLIFLNLGWGV